MDTILIILGSLFILAGFICSFLPVIPGPPLSYLGLLTLQLTSESPFGLSFFIVWALIVIAIMGLDNVIPVYGAKRYGGSSYGIWGSVLGLVGGMFFPPAGLVLGPIAGAFVGELVAGKKSEQAARAAWGSFLGFMAGTILKVIASAVMGYYFFTNI